MVYSSDHKIATKLHDAFRGSFSKLFKGPRGRQKHQGKPHHIFCEISLSLTRAENNQRKLKNREQSVKDKREQDRLNAEINSKLAIRRKSPPVQSLRSDAKGKHVAMENSNQDAITLLPGIGSYIEQSSIPVKITESSTLPQPLHVGPVSSFDTFVQSPQRLASPSPQMLFTPAMESSDTTRSEPSVLPSQQQKQLDPEVRHSESGPSTVNAQSDPRRQHILDNIVTISSTKTAETLIPNNNPYHNGAY